MLDLKLVLHEVLLHLLRIVGNMLADLSYLQNSGPQSKKRKKEEGKSFGLQSHKLGPLPS